MIIARLLGLAAAAGALAACGAGTFDFGISEPNFPPPPALRLGNVGVLRGDTVRVRVSYCPRYSSCVDTATVAWRTTSKLFEFLVGNVPVTEVNSAQSVLVRGVERGIGVMSATHVRLTDNASFMETATGNGFVHVVDSTDITGIVCHDATIRVGFPVALTVFLTDASSQAISAAPTAWSVSDTTILAVTEAAVRNGQFQLTVVGRAVGMTDLHLRFRDVTEVVALTVVP